MNAEEIKAHYENSILIGTDRVNVPANGSAVASVKWTPATSGNHSIYVVVDPNNEIEETNEENNVALKNITILDERPDLFITSEDISFSDQFKMIGDTITINALIYCNEGLYGSVSFYDNLNESPVTQWNPVSYWSMEERSGNTIYDITKNDNDGTIYGATRVDGKYGEALSFDGMDDYVSLSKAILPTDGSNWSVGVCVKPNLINDGNHNVLFSQYSSGNGRTHIYELNGYWKFFFGHSNGDTNIAFGTPEIGIWNYLTFTYDGDKIRCYENAVLKSGSETLSGNIMNTDTAIGWAPHDGARYFDGTIDEVAIYNRALTEEEIKVLYENSILIGTDTINIPANGSAVASLKWTPSTPGNHTIYVVVDSNNEIKETNEENNIASKEFEIIVPEITLFLNNVSFSKENIITGDTVTIYADIHNLGSRDMTDIIINFFIKDVLIGTKTIDIKVADKTTTSIKWIVIESEGYWTINISIDQNYDVIKENLKFNIATKEIYIDDGDTYKIPDDEFPNDPQEWKDSDDDGIGDNSDLLPNTKNNYFYAIITVVALACTIPSLIYANHRNKIKKDEEKKK